ncbi:unnamed protein product [Amoebophrya sp. A25]|nr:unnamed protein product [Amoebophrya sp. A25]|eukprot:GSA25T00005524001.1
MKSSTTSDRYENRQKMFPCIVDMRGPGSSHTEAGNVDAFADLMRQAVFLNMHADACLKNGRGPCTT